MSGLVIDEATERSVALRGALAERIVIADGAMGTMLQAYDLTDEDFDGHDGCNEVLNVTRPDVVRAIHHAYLAAGADCVTTNTFGANLGNLSEYGIPERIGELSQAGAALAREVADEFTAADGRPRWVLGSIGPGTKLPTLGHVTFRELRDSYYENAAGLLRGGADALIIETCPDLLQAKAAIIGTKRAVSDLAPNAVVIASLTIETTGTMLLGTEIGAALTALAPLGIDVIGLELRHRPRPDERAPALPGRELADPDLLRAERRAAAAHRRRRLLPAHPGRAGRRARAVRDRVRPVPGRRLLRHHAGARRAARRAAGRHPGPAARARSGGAVAAAGARRRVAVQPRAVPPGHRVPRDRGADQRQRVQGVPRRAAGRRLVRLRGHRPLADPRRRPPARRLHRLRRPGRRRGHARDRRAAVDRGDAAARPRLDRARGHRGGPRADRRPRRWSTRSTTRTATAPTRGSPG